MLNNKVFASAESSSGINIYKIKDNFSGIEIKT
jgi:hypothetical protein